MRTDAHTSRLARWVTVTAILTLMGSCKEEPTPPATPSPGVTHPSVAKSEAPASQVAPGESFVLSDVTFRYDEKDSHLYVSYRVSNHSAERERLRLCADFIDSDGFFTVADSTVDEFSLRAGDSESVVDVPVFVSSDAWKASEVLRFHLKNANCVGSGSALRSNVLVLAKSGQPPPPGVVLEGKKSAVEVGNVPAPWFRLEDVRVRQDAEGRVWADYRITNLTKGRATSDLCVRLVEDTRCSCRWSAQEWSNRLSLGLGASEHRSELLEFADNENWNRGRYLLFYTTPFGCVVSPDEATSNIVFVERPSNIQIPESAQEKLGQGE